LFSFISWLILFMKGNKLVVITFNNKNKIQYKDNFIL